jgi:hypothetical protein
MGEQSARQALRQRAGFLAENLLQRFFEEQGILAVSFARRHLDEAGKRVGVDWRRHAKRLARSVGRLQGLVGVRIQSGHPELAGDYRLSREEAVVRTLLSFCDLIRWDEDRPTLSEVKSQLGPSVDFRIEFQASQMIALRDLAAAGLDVTIPYYVALPFPEFVEIPWDQLRRPEARVRESEIGRGLRFRTRVPIPYRDRARFTRLPTSIVPYASEQELLQYLTVEFAQGGRPALTD